MNIEKKENYENEMNLNGIDTFSGYIVTKKKEVPQSVANNITRFNIKPDDRVFIIVNANKTANGERLITRYSDFAGKVEQILESFECTYEDMDIVRADFCFNSRDDSFNDYQKLHRLLLSCLAIAYKYQNCYQSCDLWDYTPLSVAIKKDDSEAENYNKYRASGGRDESKNRLELRSRRMSGTTIEEQFLNRWFERLDKARMCFDAVQMKCNDHLEKLYKDDLAKPKRERNYLSLTAFLMQYRESIYTRKQMINLLSRFDEVVNPTKKADKFKEKHKIEYFSKSDLTHIINVLKKKTREYFEI